MSESRKVLVLEDAANWDPTDTLSPRQPLGRGVEVEYDSGVSTVRIQGSPAMDQRKSVSSASSEPSTPSSPVFNNLPSETSQFATKPPSQLSVSSLSSAASVKSALKSPPSTQPSNNGHSSNGDDASTAVPQTYKSEKLKGAASETSRKPVELDNISIISDIPSEPGGASISGTIRSYQASLSAISEDSVDSQLTESNNNTEPTKVDESTKPQTKGNVRIEMRKFTVPNKKVSWNESVIVTTTDSDNVMIAGLPYEASDTSSAISDSNSNGMNNSPLSSPTTEHPPVLSNLHHRSASRIYNRRAPTDSTPIVDEFELAQLGQMLGSKPVVPATHGTLPLGTPTPSVGTLTSSAGTLSLPDGPSYIGSFTVGSTVGSSSPPNVPVAQKRSGVSKGLCRLAVAVVVLCAVALLALGILYALR